MAQTNRSADFDNVGPTNFSYEPYKASHPGPLNNGGGSNPQKEIGTE